MENTQLVCVPGQRLCLADKEHISGCGTYERNGYIYSTLAGIVNVVKEERSSIIEVHSSKGQGIIPAPGDIVTAKVTIVTQKFCKCVIKCIGDTVLTRPYRAIVRKEDVCATEKDKVEISKSFRPGDIILGRVLPLTEVHTYHLSTAENELGVVIAYSESELPLTEVHTYHLSTAENELGVVIAYSESGVAMVPVSWTEMQCPKTYVKEPRKVAKVVPETVTVD